MIRADAWVPDPASLLAAGAFGAGALVRWERSDDAATTWLEVSTAAIASGQAQYTLWDSAGTAASLYRWRVSNAGNTAVSPYSAAAPGTSPTDSASGLAYADLGDVLGLFQTAITGAATGDARKLSRLQELLLRSTDELIREMGGRDYFRRPASGDKTWTQDGDGTPILHVHQGLVSLTTLEVSFDLGISYLTVDSSFWELRGADPHKTEPIPYGEPYFHVRLKPWGPYPLFIRGASTVRLTGGEGWGAIPAALREGCAERTRQLAYADPSFSGSIPGPDEYAAGGSTTDRWPRTTWNFMRNESRRFMACSL